MVTTVMLVGQEVAGKCFEVVSREDIGRLDKRLSEIAALSEAAYRDGR